ncbi:MAG: nucleoside 2-deoxyribosyltransferase domain-containing protein, partial [Firmicutes bacterium]|nr:nucleoside 2-deoxyribosyltransferase domain-containing protein [Bacillota bacterium]
MIHRVYFSAPLFSQAEKEFNEKIVGLLESIKADGKQVYRVFLPQRDGFEAVELGGFSGDEKAKKIFEKDIAEVEQ